MGPMRISVFVLQCLLAANHIEARLSGVGTSGGRANSNEEGDEMEVHVIIRYNNDNGREHIKEMATSVHQGPGLKTVHAVAATIVKANLTLLDEDPGIESIEEDYIFKPWGEIEPYGLDMIQATSNVIPSPLSENSPCRDKASFKVGIIDSGLAAGHPDIPCLDLDNPDTNCLGQSFGLGNEEYWYAPSDAHGTYGLVSE